MKIHILKNFVTPNHPQFVEGETRQVDEQFALILIERGLAEKAIEVQTMVDNVETTKKSKKSNS